MTGDGSKPSKLLIRLTGEQSDIDCEFASSKEKMLFITLIREAPEALTFGCCLHPLSEPRAYFGYRRDESGRRQRN